MGNSPSRKNRKLEKAIQGRKLKLVKRWINKGADPNGYSKKSDYSFLSMAITLREEGLVQLLLKKGANPNQKSWQVIGNGTLQRKSGNDDEYPIHIAAAHGNVNIMQALLNSQIDINTGQDHKLGTALHQAARFGHSKLADLLLANGADIIGIDSRLNTPLHTAATFGQTKVAEVLLRHGSPINASNMKSWTPLHNASSEGALSMAKLLLEHGADTKLSDTTGNTPIDVAKTEDMLRLFLEHAIDKSSNHETAEDDENAIETGPPKPVRTFVHSSDTSTRKRTKSEEIEILLEPRTNSQKLKSAKSYSDFGKWVRKHRKEDLVKRQTQEINHPPLRRIKSVPIRKRQKPKASSVNEHNQTNENKKDNKIHANGYSNEATEHRKSYSMRHRKNNKTLITTCDQTCTTPTESATVRRSKSMSAMGKKSIKAKKNENKKLQQSPQIAGAQTAAARQEKHQNAMTKDLSDNKNHANIPVRASLSRSLHNLITISEEYPSSPDRDANFNIAPKKAAQRTRSEGRQYYHKRVKQSWIESQVKDEVISR